MKAKHFILPLNLFNKLEYCLNDNFPFSDDMESKTFFFLKRFHLFNGNLPIFTCLAYLFYIFERIQYSTMYFA